MSTETRTYNLDFPVEILIKQMQQSGELPSDYRPEDRNQLAIDYLYGQIEFVKEQIEKFNQLGKQDYVEGLERSIPRLHAQIAYWMGKAAWKHTGYTE